MSLNVQQQAAPDVCTAQAHIVSATAALVIDRMSEIFDSRGARVSRSAGGLEAVLFFGEASFAQTDTGFVVTARAADEGYLSTLKGLLVTRLLALSEADKPEIVWTGDGANAPMFPNFREMTVRQIVDVTPHMRRVTLHGANLEPFVQKGMHLHLLIPPEGLSQPEWPTQGANGLPVWPAEDRRPTSRTYTVRRVDLAASCFEVDFVMHGDHDGSVGSRWASRAQPGDLLGVRGPIGRAAPEADWVLLVGDETALPVISRLLETLPATTRGIAVIEIADASEEQQLVYQADIAVRWLHRGGAEAGTGTLLLDALRTITPPADAGRVFAMAGVEQEAARAIRTFWRDELRLDRKDMVSAAYWRRGKAEEERRAATD